MQGVRSEMYAGEPRSTVADRWCGTDEEDLISYVSFPEDSDQSQEQFEGVVAEGDGTQRKHRPLDFSGIRLSSTRTRPAFMGSPGSNNGNANKNANQSLADMYDRCVYWKSWVNDRQSQERRRRQQNEMKECSFRPSISDYAKARHELRETTKPVHTRKDATQRLYEHGLHRGEAMEEWRATERRKESEKEEHQCTFTPYTNETNARSRASRQCDRFYMIIETNNACHVRRYEFGTLFAEEKMNTLQTLKEEEMKKACTFRPDIKVSSSAYRFVTPKVKNFNLISTRPLTPSRYHPQLQHCRMGTIRVNFCRTFL